jgi:ribonuclease BN (tRNA processing enzyme)
MRLTIIGCGDAFSSGGRYHSCYLLDTSKGRLMIDCGATAPLALKRAAVSLSAIDAVLVSHCHGDHFGGVPFLFLDKLFGAGGGEGPLELLGPPGLQGRTEMLIDSFYPGIRATPQSFETSYRELEPGRELTWRGISIAAFGVEHYSGTPSLALRIRDEGAVFAFSGDSGWCQGVVDAGRDADLYLIECSTYSIPLSMHLDYLTLASRFDDIRAKRYLLTHFGDEMLEARDRVDSGRCLLAEDGLSVEIVPGAA